jgi:hypothetical protein
MVNKITFGQTSTAVTFPLTLEDIKRSFAATPAITTAPTSIAAVPTSITNAPKNDGFNKTAPEQKPEGKSNILAWGAVAVVAVIAAVTGRHYFKAYKLEKFVRETFDKFAPPLVREAVASLKNNPDRLAEIGQNAIITVRNARSPMNTTHPSRIFNRIFGEAEGQVNLAAKGTSEDLIKATLEKLRPAFIEAARKVGLDLRRIRERLFQSPLDEALKDALAQKIEAPVLKQLTN